MTVKELIHFLEENGDGCGLISDDAGHWAVLSSGFQNVPDNAPQDISTSFFVKADEWKPTIKEALQEFYDEFNETETDDA